MPQLLKFDIPSVTGRFVTKTWMLQRTYNWQLMMTSNINGIIGPLVSQYCQDVQFGDYMMSEISSMRYGAFQRFYAGIQTLNSATLTFLAPVDNSVYDYFKEWRKLAIDEFGFYYPKNNYSKRVYVCLYDRTGIQSSQFVLFGTFPKSLPRIVASYGSEDVLRYEVEISFDFIRNESLIGSIREGITNVAGNILGSTVKSKLGL